MSRRARYSSYIFTKNLLKFIVVSIPFMKIFLWITQVYS